MLMSFGRLLLCAIVSDRETQNPQTVPANHLSFNSRVPIYTSRGPQKRGNLVDPRSGRFLWTQIGRCVGNDKALLGYNHVILAVQ